MKRVQVFLILLWSAFGLYHQHLKPPKLPGSNIFSNVVIGLRNRTSLVVASMEQASTDPHSWWGDKTKGRSGLLVVLLPSVIAQAVVLQRLLPFFTSRLLQYLNPTLISASLLLRNPGTYNIVQNGIWTSVVTGGLFMLYDSFLTGPLWSPLHPPDRGAFAVVTGASSGLGLETAKLLYLYGFSVVLIARDSGRLAEAAETIHRADTQRKDNARWKDLMPKSSPQHKKRVITVSLDLARSDSLMALAAELHNHGVFNKIEVLVNNAGACDRREGFSSSNADSAQELVALNVNAAVSITRLLLPQMVARKRGRVVFISSITSMSPTPQQSIYAASKAFLNSFALTLRRELLPHGVLVTLALPGAIRESSFFLRTGTSDALVLRMPFCSHRAKFVADAVFAATLHGRDVVVPGLLNKVFVHGVCKLLPYPLAASIASAFWSPAPFSKQPVARVPDYDSSNDFDSFGYPTSSFGAAKKAFEKWWYSPVLDWVVMRQWWKDKFRKLTRPDKVPEPPTAPSEEEIQREGGADETFPDNKPEPDSKPEPPLVETYIEPDASPELGGSEPDLQIPVPDDRAEATPGLHALHSKTAVPHGFM